MNYKIFLLIFLFLYICYTFFKYRNIENFEDKFGNFEKYDEIYDKEFVNLYEIIYRDYSDIDFDVNIVYEKTFNKNKLDELQILVGGCGVGKLCKKLKKKCNNIYGLDISENMLMKAQNLNPNIKFIRGDLKKPNIFNNKEFSHIYIDERTLYYNKKNEIEDIIVNCYKWLKDDGFLIIQVYDPTKLQLASRYYSSKYMDNKGYIHGFTYLNDFSHDCYYIKEENTDVFNYYDKVIFDTGDKRIKKTVFNIPEKEIVYDYILNNGFKIIHIEDIRLQIVGGYELAIFQKKKVKISVNELEEKKNI